MFHSPSHLGRLLLENGIENYTILNKSCRHIDGVDDREGWRQLKVCHENLHQRGRLLSKCCVITIEGPDEGIHSLMDCIHGLVEQQQTQLRWLIATQMPKGDSFHDQLLKEIEESEQLIPRGLPCLTDWKMA